MISTDGTQHAHHEGELGYVDTFGPLLPCKVLASDDDTVTVRLTADRGTYRRGDVLTEPHDYVVPRGSVYVRDHKYRIRNDYRWVPRRESYLARARYLGADAALAAASWLVMSQSDARSILFDVDPQVLDRYPAPNLSGEWADDLTPDLLATEIAPNVVSPELTDAIADAWEEGRDAVWSDALQAHALRVLGEVDRALSVEAENERSVTVLRDEAGQ